MSCGRSARLLPAQQQCLQQKIMFATTPTHYVRRFPGEEFKPESLNLTVKHLLKIMNWCCMARSEVGHCRWNCQCDQMHWYTAEVRGAISIALFQKAYPFCLKDDNEPCHLAKLVSNLKCQNNTRTLTSLAQSQDMNPIENLWRKITLEIVKRHPTIKRKLIESLTAAWNRGVTHVHLVKLSIQFRHNAQNQSQAKAGPEYTNPSSKRKSGLLGATT